MPKAVFTQQELDNYLKDRPDAKHPLHKATVEIKQELAVHFDGDYPGKLIDERRPNEPTEVKNYRKQIWKPKTKPTCSKVFSELQKIRRSSDWAIKYDNIEQFTKVAEGETLEDYCEMNFPYFGSVTNWMFTLALRRYLIDPNAVCFVAPIMYEVAENEYRQPFPVIFGSAQVIDFVPEDYAVLLDPTGSIYYDSKGIMHRGVSYILVTRTNIYRYDQTTAGRKFALVLDILHELPELPVFSLKGVLVGQVGERFLYESRLAGMIPELDEAAREYSDLQASVVVHLYPERYEYATMECAVCKGTGMRQNPSFTGPDCGHPNTIPCNNTGCNNGYIVAGPYSKMIIKPSKNPAIDGVPALPNPPAGFIEKDSEIIKLQDERVKQHLYDALSAINFEFLADTPLNQSGKAKEVDEDALNNTVHAIAEDVVAIMDTVYRLCALWRYGLLYSVDEILEMVPFIPVPEKFAILSSARTLTELNDAKTNKANPVLTGALEIDYASKRFVNEPEVRDLVGMTLKLDPLSNLTEDEKMSRLTNKGITQQAYVISSNIQAFVQRALDEDAEFAGKKLPEQKAVLAKYADEVIKENEKAAEAAMKVMQDAMGGGLNGNGEVPEPVEEEEDATV